MRHKLVTMKLSDSLTLEQTHEGLFVRHVALANPVPISVATLVRWLMRHIREGL